MKVLPMLLAATAVLGITATAPTAAAPQATPAAPAVAAPVDCAPQGDLDFLCGLGNAEDLVLLPDTNYILAGGIGTRRGIEAKAGLRLIDRTTLAWQHWLPSGAFTIAHDAKAFPGCATPPDPEKFMAHGLAVRKVAAGKSRLYVVNHAGRESIEVFDVDTRGATPAATWIGCILPTEPIGANSVAVGPDGTVYATVFLNRGTGIEDVLAGRPTGQIQVWKPGQTTPTTLSGTQLAGNNGLEISADGKRLYAVAFGGKQLVVFDTRGKKLGSAQVEGYYPDNVRWDDRGRLILAGMTNNDAKCPEIDDLSQARVEDPCYKAFVVDAVDPKTMQVTRIASRPTTKLFSHVSHGLIEGDRLWLGTVGAQRLAYMRLP